MKSLKILSLLVLALSQLCLASDDFTKDKRFPIYDYLATKANEYLADAFIEFDPFFANLWPQFEASVLSQGIENHTFFEGHKDYKALEEAIKEYTEAVAALKGDKMNCDLQKNAQEKRENIYSSEPSWKWREFNKYEEAVIELNGKLNEHRRTKLEEIFEELPKVIETFLSTLSEEDKKNELALWCQKFLIAESFEEKQIMLLEISEFDNNFNSSNIEELGKSQCKWNLRDYEVAFHGMKTHAMQSVP